MVNLLKTFIERRGCFDVCEADIGAGSPSSRDSVHSDSEQQSQQRPLTSAVDQESGRDVAGDSGQSGSFSYSVTAGLKKFPSVSMLQENVLSAKRFIGDGDRYTLLCGVEYVILF